MEWKNVTMQTVRSMSPLRVALIGTRGVPAHYGGFETAVEEVGSRLVERGHAITVYCRRAPGDAGPAPRTHLGMDLVTLPALRMRALETLSHSTLSVLHPSIAGVDAAIVFNAANAPLLPVLRARGVPTATHVDGIEWKRAKWQGNGSRYYRAAEAMAVRFSDALIADARGISEYYREEFGASTHEIAYGAPIIDPTGSSRLTHLELSTGGYHLVVARFEPENHVLEIIRGYVASSARLPLVVVGSAPYSHDYTRRVRLAGRDPRVRFLGGVWDQDLLDELYANAASYLHGHSVGGTNPSLLRASGAGTSVIAFDVGFNREVVGDDALFFSSVSGLRAAVENIEAHPKRARRRGRNLKAAIARYSWESVTDAYDFLLHDLAATGPTPLSSHPSGRRLSRPSRGLEPVPAGALALPGE